MDAGAAKEAYGRLSTRRQVASAKGAALRALAAFPVEPVRLRLLNHGFNTTFRVDCADQSKFAVRVNVNSRQTPEKLAAEAAWVEALGKVPGVSVPRPVPTRDGPPWALGEMAPGWSVPVVLYTWLGGGLLGFEADPERYRELGAMAACLHAHAKGWKAPEARGFFVFTDPLAGQEWIMPEDADFRAVYSRAQSVLARLAREAPIPIHYDLHPWNVMLYRRKVSILDFDDAMLGWPVLDASVASFYYRDSSESRLREAKFLEGLGLAQYGFAEEDYETLVASRQLLLLNDFLGNVTAEIVRKKDQYLEATRARLRHFLETGVFDRSVFRVE
jgi:Ser/Thr protein kinase RdoA (MazF antagonist)